MKRFRAYDLEYPEFMNSIKTSLFFESWIEEKEEEFLMETYGIRPGEIRMKIESANWLVYAAEELAKINGIGPTKLIKYGAKILEIVGEVE